MNENKSISMISEREHWEREDYRNSIKENKKGKKRSFRHSKKVKNDPRMY